MTDDTCLICSMEDTPDDSRVFVDEHWAAEVPPGYEVPGWFFLRVRRHAEKITGLNADEAAGFGRHAQDLIAAVERATGAPCVYLLSFGENHLHFHVLIVARGIGVPPALRGGAVLQLLADGKDPAAAMALVPSVRAAYDEILSNRKLTEVG